MSRKVKVKTPFEVACGERQYLKAQLLFAKLKVKKLEGWIEEVEDELRHIKKVEGR